MPELPEVETVRRLCETHLAGHVVRKFEVTLPKLLRQSVTTDPAALVGRTLLRAGRHAKVLDLAFSGDLHLLVHFKLAGQWALLLPDGERFVAGHPVPKLDSPLPHKSSHASITFEDGRTVWYSDIRQFGWFNIIPAADVAPAITVLGLGPEATGPIDIDRLFALLQRRTVPIKAVLLDQSVLSGLGNIYVDEALFAARVHPSTPARSLEGERVERLAAVIPGVLAEGIRQGGATIIHARAFPDNGFPAVHGREGEPCFRCGATIEKSRVAGRGTYICPACQLMDGS